MRDHGYARYRLDGCRCYTCARAVSEYERRRQRLIAYGRWRPFVDAAPVREHVFTLKGAGIGRRRLAELSGVSGSVISALLRGRPSRGSAPSARLRPATAARLLAVEPTLDAVADCTNVDATATVRRLQALVAVGWSGSKLAARLGMGDSNFSTMMLRARQVTARRARAVAALYSELWDQAPPEADRRARIAASRARNYAAERGWVPPMAWDDDLIGDPNATPDRGATASKTAALAENAAELAAQGYTREQTAERLGVSKSALEHAIARTVSGAA